VVLYFNVDFNWHLFYSFSKQRFYKELNFAYIASGL
jgi:hypothetical protein